MWRTIHPPKPPFSALALGTAHPLWLSCETSPFWITKDERARHVYVLGASGAGKTKALESWIRQDPVSAGSILIFASHRVHRALVARSRTRAASGMCGERHT